MNKLKIEYLKTDELIPYENNPKIHTEKQIEQIAKSIELTKGLRQPIVIDKNNVIVCGHGRYLAALKLGYDTVPCELVNDLTDDEIRAYRLIDNRISEGEYDLSLEFEELSKIELDLGSFDFNLDQIQLEINAKEEAHKKSKDEYETDIAKIENIHRGIFEGEGIYDMPVLEAVTELQPIKEWIGFNYVLSDKSPEGKAVHFFVDDYQFERVWNNPEKYLDKLKQYVCVATPDFSPYENMPHALQLMSHYKKQWVGRWLQYHGVTVIPTIRPVYNRDWWLDGIPEGGIYISSAMWSKNVDDATEENSEYDKIIIDRLKPKKIFMYRGGGDNLYKKHGIECEYIKSFSEMRWGNANK